MFKTLDVGSGAHPSGDVNVDLYITDEERKRAGLKARFEIPPVLVKADAHYLPFAPETFEGIICFHTLEHLLCPYTVLREMYGVLKKGGKIVIDVPNVKLITTEHKTHYYSWSVSSLQNLIRRAGFSIVKVTPEIKSLNMQVVGVKQ